MTDDAVRDARTRYLNLEEQEQDAHWGRGQIVFEVVRGSVRKAANPREARRFRASVLRDFAGEVGRTVTSVRQQVEVYAAFGLEDTRAAERPWHWHLAVLRAAHRNDLSPAELLTAAVEKGWTVAQLNALGKTAPVQAECCGECVECGVRVRLALPGDRVRPDVLALTLRCPVCVAILLRDQGSVLEAARIGQLEAAGGVQTA